MKLQATVFFTTMLLSTTVFTHEQESQVSAAASQITPEAQPVVAVVEEFSTALQAADFERVSALLADDVLILESGGAERSKEEYLGHHALADASFLKAAHVEVTRRTARVDGSLAWVGTESELHAQQDGKPIALSGTETMVLKRMQAGWRIVHIHWSSRPKQHDTPSTATP